MNHGRRISQHLVRFLTALSENTYLSAIRAGMVSVVPLTIIGGLFVIVTELPISGWEETVKPYASLLHIPYAATFGVLAVFVCFFIGHDLGRQLKQEPVVSAGMATLIFLLIELRLEDQTLAMESLGSRGLFTAILVALVVVRVQKLFSDWNLVIRLPAGVPAVVYESFVSLFPLLFLVLVFWGVRFVLGIDIDRLIQSAFQPLIFGLNTLPGILVYAFLVTLLWSVGVNGDNAMDAIVAPVFLQYLSVNTEAMTQGLPLPYLTANGFFTTFVNVGGTGATLALGLVLLRSRDPAFRQVSRLSLPTQIFQINEPIFFGLPIVLNPVFMVPYILNALFLTGSTFLLMDWGLIRKPCINVPWTTPPILGHYLVTGGDWRAAVWGVVSLGLAMAIYWPFARIAERSRKTAPPASSPGAP